MQVNELPGMASQPSFNPNNALASYNFDDVMFDVEHFFSHPTRGLGIDLYWVRKDFTALGEEFIPDSNLPPMSPNRYRFNDNLSFDHDLDDLTPELILSSGGTLVLQDNRLITPAYASPFNLEQYRAYARRDKSTFLQESRDPSHDRFVKLLLMDRAGEVRFTGQGSSVITEAQIQTLSPYALSFTQSKPLEQQGAFICVASMAEEGFQLIDRNYTGEEFLNQLIWAIAHELGHLLTVDRINLPRHHFPTPGTLMTDVNPVPLGITAITASAEEIATIDLKTRYSVSH